MLVENGSGPRLVISDTGVYDVAALEKSAPHKHAQLRAVTGRLETLLRRLEA